MDNPGASEPSAELDVFSAANGIEALLGGEQEEEKPEAEQEASAETEAEQESEVEGEQEESEQAEPQKVKVKVDGKEVELTEAEIAEAVKGQMRQADYTKKTMEAAEQRKTAEAETAKARQERDAYAQKLEAFAGQANYELQVLASQLTDELLQSDPVAYLTTQRTVQQRQAQLEQANREMLQINDQRTKEKAESDRNYLAQQQEQLLTKLPEWRDADKAKAEVTKIKDYLAKQGYEGSESDFSDHRAVILARKAMLFDELTAKAKVATQKIAAVPPKVERPGNAESRPKLSDGRTAAMQRLNKTGSIDSAAALIEQMLS